jgi:hypothetical protein
VQDLTLPSPLRRCGAGIHSWGWTDEEFPLGIVPPVAKLWHDAIINGFFVQ